MAWWEEDSVQSSSTSVVVPPLPSSFAPLPRALPELLETSRRAGSKLDHVTSWRVVSSFARSHWLTDAPRIPSGSGEASASPGLGEAKADGLSGEYYALRHAVADQLEMSEEAATARSAWLRWATEANIYPAILHARSYGAFAEAEAFVDANPGDAITGRRPTDTEIPEVVSLAAEICTVTPEPARAYNFLLSAAVTGAAASLARRADIAEKLAQWSSRWAPKRSSYDDRKLLAAQLAHSRGELRKAATIAAAVAASPQSEPVTTMIEARQFLAFLCLEAGEEDEAIDQLRPVVEVGLAADLTVAVLGSVRLLCALLNARGDYAESAGIARRGLEAAEGMPVNPISMDVQLILARSLLGSEDTIEALRFAEPVAHWSTLTTDEERTDAAFSIAAAAAARSGMPQVAAQLLIEHGEHLERIGDTKGAAKAYRQAARSTIHIIDLGIDDECHVASDGASTVINETLMAAEDLLLRSNGLIADDWSLADWHDDAAYIFYYAGRDSLASFHVDAAAQGYADCGDGEEAARALLAGVRYRLDAGDRDGATDYANRVEALLPRDVWDGHPVLETLDAIVVESLDDEP